MRNNNTIKEKEKAKRVGGVSLSLIQTGIAVLSVLITAATFFAVFRTISSYKDMDKATDMYIDCEKYASDLKEASDYLTSQVRIYAVNGDMKNLENYFTEINITKRRDKAVEFMKNNFGNSKEYDYLKKSLDESNALVLIEYYSMRLRAESNGADISSLPEELRNVELDPEDASLSSEEKRKRSIELVYDSVYEGYKARIAEAEGLCVDAISNDSLNYMRDGQRSLLTLLKWQEAFIVLLLVIVILTFLLTHFMVMRPIKAGVEKIRSGYMMDEKGAKEMRVFSRIYNKIYEENTKANETLSFEANHDVLSGLYNRTAFDKILSIGGWDNVAFLIIDVDNFKCINDTFGHQAGDKVITAVGAALSSTFRSGDFVCRLGGDEFAIVMVDVSHRMKELIRFKFNNLSKLLNANDEIPKDITLSAGAAFGNWGEDSQKIFRNADKALYDSKEKGRNRISFYNEE